MNNELISVIVPVYNVKKYLVKCIDSVISQTYKNIEIILVDDGSDDGSGELCDKCAENDSRIKVIHKPNGGLSSARNTGIDCARGDFISFIDSDDYIHPSMLDKLLTAMRHDDADMAVCGMEWVNEDGSRYDSVMKCPIQDAVYNKQEAMNLLSKPGYFYYVTSVNKLYKKQIFKNIRFPLNKRHEDEYTIHRFFDWCTRIACIKDILYFYVQRSDSIMHEKFAVGRLDTVGAFLDRAIFFRLNGYCENYRYTVSSAHYILMKYLKQEDVYKYRKEFFPYLCAVAKLVKFRFGTVKMFYLYFSKVIAGALLGAHYNSGVANND